MAASHTPVQSIDRVLDIIEALSFQPHGMLLKDLSAAVGLHVSTTHRLLVALVSRGYVQKNIETGKYRLTVRLFEVGNRAIGGINLVSLSRPYLERLAAEIGETVHLVARNDDEVVYLYKRIVERVLSIWRPSLAFARLCTAQLSVKAYFLICRKQKSAPFGIDPSLNRAHKIQL